VTNFLPGQLLGPRLNGWRAVLLSSSKRGSIPNHLSGMKSLGQAKLDEEWKDAY